MEKIGPLLEAEAKHAWQLYKDGIFRELYFRQDHPGVVVVMECFDVEEAEAIMADLPLVKADLIEIDFVPVGPFVVFEELFAKE